MAFCWLLVFLSERISTNTDSHFELSLELRKKITLVEGLVLQRLSQRLQKNLPPRSSAPTFASFALKNLRVID